MGTGALVQLGEYEQEHLPPRLHPIAECSSLSPLDPRRHHSLVVAAGLVYVDGGSG